MALGSVRAVFRGLRDKASEPDASTCFATDPPALAPPVVHLAETYATALTCFQIRPNCSYSSHECDVRHLPRVEGDGRGLRFGRAQHSWGATPRRDTPGGVKLIGF